MISVFFQYFCFLFGKITTVVSGIRPTGQLHLGNYFGALRNFVKLQHEARCFFFIADYHALTTHDNPEQLHENVRTVLAEYIAAGMDPQAATIYVQSDVPQVTELSLLLSMHAYVGELERTASFKDKVRKNPSNVKGAQEPVECQCRIVDISGAYGG